MNNLERVRPEDFDVAELMQEAREGNLFKVKKVKSADIETVKRNVCAYVQRIDPFVTQNYCHCFACNKGGDVIAYTMQHEQWTFLEACQWLSQTFGICTVQS